MLQFNEEEKSFYLHTEHSTYVILINEFKHLEHVYYGGKITNFKNINEVRTKYEFELGSSTSYSKDAKGYSLNTKLLEFSTYGKGDYREPTVHIELPSGSRTTDFVYQSHTILKNVSFPKMPQVIKEETLVITLFDSHANVSIKLFYTIFEKEDIIVRNLEIINHNQEEIMIDKALSFNLDLLNQNYILSKLDGAWIRERHINDVLLTKGTVRIDSKKGVSSSDHNPFFMLKEQSTKEDYGKAYGFTLIYSGNFEANIETSPHDFLRVNMGINSFDFRYPLQANETFVTPEVIMTFSNKGLNQLSQNFHQLINEFIINENQQFKDRPILVNNWEATYFDFNEKKLLAIAKKAKKLGIELFCLDDGWFGKRNDDFSSLGDWYYNQKKLPRGVKGLCHKINKLGLDFGIWVEPEMISIDSDLYRAHPDWAVFIPNTDPALGRNQLILDLTNPFVIQYLKDTLSELFQSANIKYVKWDMNRNFSDVFSQSLKIKDQGKFHHLYVLGLYDLLEYLTTTFPNILFESCSSGGNRFDVGMLYYMPQTWTSDNTDAYERLFIQEGTSLIYPLSTISNHVSGERSHQVMRHTPLETRFNVASFGVLGYEMDLSILTPFEEKIIQKQIEFYKEYRHLLQYGTFKRLKSVYDSNYSIWMVISEDKKEAILGFYQKLAIPNPTIDSIRIPTLNPENMYCIKNRTQYTNIRTFGSLVNEALPIKLKVNHFLHNVIANRYLFKLDEFKKELTGAQLEEANLLLHHQFTGTGYNDSVMLLEDFGSRLFIIKEENC
ncbi:MAG: alpha-galactosidase [Bacilli bacterium]|nr:alpha-galactosidase [Bacilli bacterium]